MYHSTYGSGYPRAADTRGVKDKDFPFIFWPIVYEPSPKWRYYQYSYLYDEDEVRSCHLRSNETKLRSKFWSMVTLIIQADQEDPSFKLY